jgi:NAD(P)-dependent dehydrogenase (short-subunit alcohol dehydrogenase family)
MNANAERLLDRRAMLGLTAAAVAGTVAGCSKGVAPQMDAGPARRRFEGKIVLITGATSGIGRAAALQFAQEGGMVCFCGRREGLGRGVEQEIESVGGKASYVRADVRNESDVKAFVNGVAERYGRIDVAFNNAGITLERPLHELSVEEFDDIANTNLRGVFLAMKYEIPHMLAQGGGNIVVTSSSNAIATEEKRSAYTASKRGLVGLVQAAALDYVRRGIRINALIPGTTDTALVRRLANMEKVPDAIWEAAALEWAKVHIPEGRMAKAEEIASFALALASDDFPFMTGAQMVIDGGKTAHAG